MVMTNYRFISLHDFYWKAIGRKTTEYFDTFSQGANFDGKRAVAAGWGRFYLNIKEVTFTFTFRFAFTHVSEEQSTMLRDVTLTVSSKRLDQREFCELLLEPLNKLISTCQFIP